MCSAKIHGVEVKLFQHPDKNTKLEHEKPLTPILTPMQLLEMGQREQIISKVTQTLGFDFLRTESMIVPLIKNVINHSQSLPDSFNRYYTYQGGLFDYALKRTEVAIDLLKQRTVLENNEFSEKQLLWVYVVFSAGLLKGIGKIYVDFSIKLYDAKFKYVKKWNPVLDRLNGKGFYTFSYAHEEDEEFRANMNLLLARTLMPEPGFAFIASNPKIFKIWVALLQEKWPKTGGLGALLDHADYLAIYADFERLLEELKKQNINFKKSFMDPTQDPLQKERLIGIEFLQWLKDQLENGKEALNKDKLHLTRDGVFISSDIFKVFLTTNPHIKQWQIVQRGFFILGLNRGGLDIEMLTQTWGGKEYSGFILNNVAAILPEKVNVYNKETNKVEKVDALEVISAQQQGKDVKFEATKNILDANGSWVLSSEVNQNNLKPGNISRA